jgi:hypothetical protein
MKDLALTITIDKPVADVFAFTLNPKNTPKWIDAIIEEETSEWPVKLGTIYRNRRNRTDPWTTYELTGFEQDKEFVLSEQRGKFRVRYLFAACGEGKTRLDFCVGTDAGKPGVPFTMQPLEKLKRIIEG